MSGQAAGGSPVRFGGVLGRRPQTTRSCGSRSQFPREGGLTSKGGVCGTTIDEGLLATKLCLLGMSPENAEIVRRGYALYESGDLEGLLALFDSDAELADAGGLGISGTAAGTRRGPEGFLRANEEALDAFEDYRIETGEFIEAGDSVVVPVRISGRGRGSGVELDIQLVHLWALRDGKVIRGEVYRTTEEALEAAGTG